MRNIRAMKQQLIIRFTKKGDIRFISHHDLMRVFERAFRRAHIPIAFRGAFNPRPRISLPCPITVGFEGDNEVLVCELERWVSPPKVARALSSELPPGLEILEIYAVPTKLSPVVESVTYEVLLGNATPPTDYAIQKLLSRRQIWVERRTDKRVRIIDIRPFVKDIVTEKDRLIIHLLFSPKGSARPEEVTCELGLAEPNEPFPYEIRRTDVSIALRK